MTLKPKKKLNRSTGGTVGIFIVLSLIGFFMAMPLVYAISSDEGKNWSEPIAIETDENSGYCYVAIHEAADGGILLAYCAGGPIDGSTLNRLRIKKLFLED